MDRRRTAEGRVAHRLGQLASVVLVLLLLYAGAAAYSASRFRAATPASGPTAAVAGNVVTVTTSVTLTNGGWFPLRGLTLATQLRLPNGSALGAGGSPSATVPAGGTVAVPIAVEVDLDRPGAASLLTANASLPEAAWANASYAGLAEVRLAVDGTFDWGAPFAGWSVAVGTPATAANGSTVVPVVVAFTDAAAFPVTGNLTVRIGSTTGVVCGGGVLRLDVAAGAGFRAPVPIPTAAGCDPTGGSVSVTFVGYGLDVTLPGGALA